MARSRFRLSRTGDRFTAFLGQFAPTSPPRFILERRRELWRFAAFAGLLLSWLVAGKLVRLTNAPLATWLEIEIAAPVGDPAPLPPLAVDTGRKGPAVPITWPNGKTASLLSVELVEKGNPASLRKLVADGTVLPLNTLPLPPGWTAQPDGTLLVAQSGSVILPGNFRRLELSLSGPAPTRVAVTLDGVRQLSEVAAGNVHDTSIVRPETVHGWILLPEQSLETLSVTGATADLNRVARITLHGAAKLFWSSSADGAVAAWRRTDGRIDLPLATALNPRSWLAQLLLTGLLTAGGLAGLALVTRWSDRLRANQTRRPWLLTPAGQRFDNLLSDWSRSRLLLLVFCVLVGIHGSWAVFAPIQWTNDSRNYFEMGSSLLRTGSLDAISLYRTPGYPAFVAAAVALFGDSLQGIVVLQHVALMSLGLFATTWLRKRTNAVCALAGGLAVGGAPLLCLCANIIWTEVVFAVVTSLAILCLGDRRLSLRRMFTAGLLIGAATMVRPTGLYLLPFAFAAIGILWWCRLPRPGPLLRCIPAGACLLAGFLVISLPWVFNFHRRANHWGLATAEDFTLWCNNYIQSRANDPALPANAAIRPLLQYPTTVSYRGRDPWLLMSQAEQLGLPWNDEFLRRATTQSIASDTAGYAGDALAAGFFVSTFSERFTRDNPRRFVFAELRWMLAASAETRPGTNGVGNEPYSHPYMAERARDATTRESLSRRLLEGASLFSLLAWPLLCVLGIAGWLLRLVRRPAPLPLVALFWIGFVFAAPTLIAMPADRYVVPVEPLLVLGVVLGGHSLFWRRATSAKPTTHA